jgi:Cys-tRNA(Pro)/Cys-tRNA(Cys) deacylase
VSAAEKQADDPPRPALQAAWQFFLIHFSITMLPMKTNAVRLLDAQGVEYQLRTYEIEDEHFSAEQVADLVGMPYERVFKTLITLGDRSGPILALVPAGTDLDLKLLASASGNKKVELAPFKQVLDLTGYERGAVTPLGVKRTYPVFIEETAILWETIALSGGMKGLQIVIKPQDLIEVLDARLADLV